MVRSYYNKVYIVSVGGNTLDHATKDKKKSIIASHLQYGVEWKIQNGIHYGEKHLKKHIVNIMSGKNNDVHIYWLNHFTQRDFCFDDGEWIVCVEKMV